MKPTILKVFSTYPKEEKLSYDLKTNCENRVIKISRLDDENQLKMEPIYNIMSDAYNDEFPLCNYDSVLNDDGNDTNKDWNVLEDFYKFQERRSALIDNKKAMSCGSHPTLKGSFDRPNYSYTQLIYMAIESSVNKALTVNDIYTWCEQNFPYYAEAVHGWKNSLRHNLSINKCFKKITKPGLGGRGSFWVVDPRERHHLVSTMHRTNVTNFKPSIIIQRRTTGCDLVAKEEEIHESVQDILDNNPLVEDCNGIASIDEKPRQDWTDTRLDTFDNSHLPVDNQSELSDTDHNDWQRSVLAMQPTFPVKWHWYNQCLVTPLPQPDHAYCIPNAQVVLNNPLSSMRHSFHNQGHNGTHPPDSFSTSSDYNDEDWPRTPSPVPLHLLGVRPLPDSDRPIPPPPSSTSSGKKRGRPRKTPPAPKPLHTHKSTLAPPPINQIQSNNDSSSNRINNMYNLNAFFNSL